MKIRSGFVSNSSSSSFIVIGTATPKDIAKLRGQWGGKKDLIIIPDLGCHQFGWESTKYTHFWDRVFFAWIQAASMQKKREKGGRPEWMRMLNKVLKNKLKVKNIYWNGVSLNFNEETKDWCYIDHQSAAIEGRNTEMFESEEALINFLFASDSYIQGGNDNE